MTIKNKQGKRVAMMYLRVKLLLPRDSGFYLFFFYLDILFGFFEFLVTLEYEKLQINDELVKEQREF